MALVLDNGGYAIRYGGVEDRAPSIAYNCLARIRHSLELAPASLVGHKEIYRPIERGLLVDLTLQTKIWQAVLSAQTTSEQKHRLVMNVPLFTPPTIRQSVYEIVFEQLDVAEFLKVGQGCEGSGVLVDAGFSGCTITPFYLGVPILQGVKRVSVGGKLLTNFLKEQISFRQYDMREETWIVNDVKEKLCRVSLGFLGELRDGQFSKRYELPEHGGVGRVLEPDEIGGQVLRLGNLEVSVPELLFNPSDVGLNEAGIPEAIMQALQNVDPAIHNQLLSNLLITGGSSNFPHF